MKRKLHHSLILLFVLFPLCAVPVSAYVLADWQLLAGILVFYLSAFLSIHALVVFTLFMSIVWIVGGFDLHHPPTFFFFCLLFGFVLYKAAEKFVQDDDSDGTHNLYRHIENVKSEIFEAQLL